MVSVRAQGPGTDIRPFVFLCFFLQLLFRAAAKPARIQNVPYLQGSKPRVRDPVVGHDVSGAMAWPWNSSGPRMQGERRPKWEGTPVLPCPRQSRYQRCLHHTPPTPCIWYLSKKTRPCSGDGGVGGLFLSRRVADGGCVFESDSSCRVGTIKSGDNHRRNK
ncbi:hypothetical protein B0T11DRAFT_275212 [Plectosphaerella cucumerina]|uniref:Secreted protein n=1 Tax=Plectosphaerella cucumerina TaxID=40658 RepID=A0A8K0TJ71_9PEZI|nr:hypothetical protein B0T11DRAFT_275212 [Plectosphaerella cucumerina]